MTIIALILAALVVAIVLVEKKSSSNLVTYARNAGFSGVDLPIAVAIALAESSGNPKAKGDLNLGVSIGLWQINLRAHPEYSEEELYDPQTNANAAFAIYTQAGNSFRPWSTFKNRAYEAHLDAANKQVNA